MRIYLTLAFALAIVSFAGATTDTGHQIPTKAQSTAPPEHS